MRSGFMAVFGLLALVLASSDASALCAGGGMMGGRGMGGISSVSHGGGGGIRKAEKKFQKWELPAAVEPAKLDTARFDEVASSLGLSSEQLAKVEAAKKDIRSNIEQLAKAQNEARSAYAGAPGEITCTAVARDVMGAAAACKSFDAKLKFESTLALILTFDQRAKYRELMTKKS